MIPNYTKLIVEVPFNGMSKKPKIMELVVCGNELDQNGNVFYRGWDENGKVKYFRPENIVRDPRRIETKI